MSIVWGEKPKSRGLVIGSENHYQIAAIAKGSTDQAAIAASAIANTTLFPIYYTAVLNNGASAQFVRDRISVDPIPDTHTDPVTWDVVFDYILLGYSQQPYETGQNSTTFEIGTQSINVKSGLLVGLYPSLTEAGAPEVGNLIGVDAEGNINGVDVDSPTFTWTETHYLAAAAVTEGYVADIYSVAAAPVLNADFRGFAAYEVRFLGLQGARRFAGGDWELSFKFAANPNKTDMTIGDIGGIACNGWDYAWAYSVQKESNNHISADVRAVYVHQVYKSSDVDLLGIGTGSLI